MKANIEQGLLRLGIGARLAGWALAFASLAAHAGSVYDQIWTVVHHYDDSGGTHHFTQYVEPTTITRSGKTVAFWEKTFESWDNNGSVTLFTHVILNCETQELSANGFATSAADLYAGKIMNGQLQSLGVASPGSPAMAEVKALCQR
jgi:hypothetical protein